MIDGAPSLRGGREREGNVWYFSRRGSGRTDTFLFDEALAPVRPNGLCVNSAKGSTVGLLVAGEEETGFEGVLLCAVAAAVS